MTRKLIALSFAAALVAVSPRAAAADVFFTPFAGVTFEGPSVDNAPTYGGSLTFMGDVAGIEIDLGYTPDFFGEEAGFELISDSHVTTLTGNLLLGVGEGPVRPYGVLGLGLLRLNVDIEDIVDTATTNDMAFSVGGGIIGMLSEHVALRGDVRYFRTFRDDDSDEEDIDLELGDFDFWRATAGISFGF